MKLIEQVIPVAIAISCHFRLFSFRYGLTLADNFSERPAGVVLGGASVPLLTASLAKECNSLRPRGLWGAFNERVFPQRGWPTPRR